MSETPKEQKFHSLLYSALYRYVENNDTKFSEVSIEKDVEGRRADIHLESNLTGSLVIEVKRDDISPYDKGACHRKPPKGGRRVWKLCPAVPTPCKT